MASFGLYQASIAMLNPMTYNDNPLIGKGLSIDLQRFAAADEGRTELPSERRKREERQRGNVPRSQEIVSASILLSCVCVLFVLGVSMFGLSKNVFIDFLSIDYAHVGELIQIENLKHLFYKTCINIIKIVSPLLAVAMIVGIVSNIAQTGFLFTLHPLGFNFSKIKPDFKRVLPTQRAFFQLLKILIQVFFIALSSYIIIKNDYTQMLKSTSMDLQQAIFLFVKVSFKLLAVAGVILALIAVPDFLYQRHEYIENMKITLSEAKRERREEEGDPLVRRRQRDRTYELRKNRSMLEDTAKADVVITNPSHYAVGLLYDLNTSQAPRVISKGVDHLAFLIRNVARENKVPIVENPPLARALYADVDLGREIPETLYKVVSLVFAKLDKFKSNANR